MYITVDKQKIGINNFLPESWLNKEIILLFSCYRVKIKQELSPLKLSKMDIFNARALFFYGKLEYSKRHAPQYSFPGESDQYSIAMLESELDNYMLVVTPSLESENQESQDMRINEYVAIMNITLGRGLTHEHIVTNSLKFKLNGRAEAFSFESSISVGILDPVNYSPKLGSQDAVVFTNIYQLILELDDGTRNRFLLGLNWYLKSIFQNPIDSFLSIWIAIESIGIENGTNISPIKEDLSKILGCKVSDLEDLTGIGKIFGLRSEIVHNGKRPRLDRFFNDYLRNIFIELILYKLKYANLRTMKQTIIDFDHAEYLN